MAGLANPENEDFIKNKEYLLPLASFRKSRSNTFGVKNLREFLIPHLGLKEGIHRYDFRIDSSFFKHFQDSPISGCDVEVKLELDKKSSFFVLNFFIDGWVEAECDRCLEQFRKPIFGDFTTYVKFEDPSKPESSDDTEVVYISRNDDFIDVSQLIYENIVLCLPMQMVHPKLENGEEGCNPDVLRLLRDRKTEEAKPDERWNKLKDLRFEN